MLLVAACDGDADPAAGEGGLDASSDLFDASPMDASGRMASTRDSGIRDAAVGDAGPAHDAAPDEDGGYASDGGRPSFDGLDRPYPGPCSEELVPDGPDFDGIDGVHRYRCILEYDAADRVSAIHYSFENPYGESTNGMTRFLYASGELDEIFAGSEAVGPESICVTQSWQLRYAQVTRDLTRRSDSPCGLHLQTIPRDSHVSRELTYVAGPPVFAPAATCLRRARPRLAMALERIEEQTVTDGAVDAMTTLECDSTMPSARELRQTCPGDGVADAWSETFVRDGSGRLVRIDSTRAGREEYALGEGDRLERLTQSTCAEEYSYDDHGNLLGSIQRCDDGGAAVMRADYGCWEGAPVGPTAPAPLFRDTLDDPAPWTLVAEPDSGGGSADEAYATLADGRLELVASQDYGCPHAAASRMLPVLDAEPGVESRFRLLLRTAAGHGDEVRVTVSHAPRSATINIPSAPYVSRELVIDLRSPAYPDVVSAWLDGFPIHPVEVSRTDTATDSRIEVEVSACGADAYHYSSLELDEVVLEPLETPRGTFPGVAYEQ